MLKLAVSKYEQLGSVALKIVRPDGDLHVRVATGSPGLNDINSRENIVSRRECRIKDLSSSQRRRLAAGLAFEKRRAQLQNQVKN